MTVNTVLLVEALVIELLVPLGQAMVMPLVTELVFMAVENVAVSGAATAPEIPVVPVVLIVVLDPELSKVPVNDDTDGVELPPVVNTYVAAVTAVPAELVTHAPIDKVQEVAAGNVDDGVTV